MVEKKEVPPVIEGQELTVKQILEKLPEQMVWRTTESLQKFKQKTQLVEWDKIILGQLIHDIIELIADYETSLKNIDEVAETQRIWYDTYETGKARTLNADFIAACVKELALEIRQSLLNLRAYQYRGVLMYEFKDWIGDDVLLERLPYDRISFLDEPEIYKASLREISRANHPEYLGNDR